MGRTKQTARKSSGGAAPRVMRAAISKRAYYSAVTSMQSPRFNARGQAIKSSYVRAETTMAGYELTPTHGATTSEPFSTLFSAQVDFDPVTKEREGHFGLNVLSRFDNKLTADTRPVAAIVVALDVSGSMGSRFGTDSPVSKLEGAKQCLFALLDTLTPADTLAIILFDHEQRTLLEPTRMADIDLDALREDILHLYPRGGTNLSGAMNAAMEMLADVPEAWLALATPFGGAEQPRGSTRRVLYMTDLQTTSGTADDESRAVEVATVGSKEGRFVTVVGMGMDLNTDMVRKFSSVLGGRYMSAGRPDELAETCAKDFDYDITMTARDIRISASLEGRGAPPRGGWLQKAYGSPEVDSPLPKSKGTYAISSEFPTCSRKGGMYVFRLHPRAFRLAAAAAGSKETRGALRVQWRDTSGMPHEQVHQFVLPAAPQTACSLPELAKAVALVRFVEGHNTFVDSCKDRAGVKVTQSTASKSLADMLALRAYFIEILTRSGDHTLANVNKGDLQLIDKMIECEANDAGIPVPTLPPVDFGGAASGAATSGGSRRRSRRLNPALQAAAASIGVDIASSVKPSLVGKRSSSRAPRRLNSRT